MLAEPYGAPEIGPTPVSGPASGASGWLGRYGARWARTRDRADARAAAAVRDAEGLVQVEVRDVGAEPARLGQPDERVEVGAVDVDLAARVVHQGAELGDGVLEDAVRGRVGHHDRGEVVAVGLDLGAQVVHVDVAAGSGLDHDDLHARP